MAKFCSSKLADYGNYKTAIVSGIPFQEIITKANEIGAALIVIGTHGRTGLEHLVFGSTAERVVRGASCPVLSVRLPWARVFVTHFGRFPSLIRREIRPATLPATCLHPANP